MSEREHLKIATVKTCNLLNVQMFDFEHIKARRC